MPQKYRPLAAIRSRTLWWFCIALFIVFFTMSWMSYHAANKAIGRQIEDNTLPLTSDNVYSQIQRDLVEPTFVAALMAHDTFVRDWAMQVQPDSDPMQRYLAEIKRRFDTSLAFFVRDKTRLLYLPDEAKQIIDEQDPRSAWYDKVKALSDEKPYLVAVGQDPTRPGSMDIFIDHKVYDYQQNFIGITGVGLSVIRVKKLIAEYQQRYQRTIFFTDRDGQVVLSGNPVAGPQQLQQMPGMKDIAVKLLSSPSGSYHYSVDGERIFVNARLVPEFNWYLLVEEHETHAQHGIFKTFLVNVGIAAAVTLMVLLINWLTQGRYQRRLAAQAALDPLTRALNRRSGKEWYRAMVRENEQQQRPVSIMGIDIDHFKAINDQFGHGAGDMALREVVQQIRKYIRETDAICRWGGEEFVVLFNGCDEHQAAMLAERIRESIEQMHFEYNDKVFQLTISGSVAQCHPGESLDEVIKRADIALYQAKHLGRNQIQYVEE